MGIKSEQCVYCGESSAWPRDQAVKTKLARSKRERRDRVRLVGCKISNNSNQFFALAAASAAGALRRERRKM